MKRFAVFVLALMVVVSMAMPAAASMEKEKADKKAVVLAVFGTTYPTALKSILNLQRKMEEAFPGIPVKMAFTSEIVRAEWAQRGTDAKWRQAHPEIPAQLYDIKNPLATIANLQGQGYRCIAVQSTHVFAGEEYQNLKAEIKALGGIETLRERDKPFKKIFVGRPALGEAGDVHPYTEDIQHAVEALKGDVALARKNRSALVYMGHGNEVLSTGAYVEFEAALRAAHPKVPVFVGTVEGFPGPEQVLNGLKHAGVKKVTLLPFMVVAGDHANNDMAGDEEDSWKSMFEAEDIKVVPVLRGLGELDAWADIYVRHLKEAMADNGF